MNIIEMVILCSIVSAFFAVFGVFVGHKLYMHAFKEYLDGIDRQLSEFKTTMLELNLKLNERTIDLCNMLQKHVERDLKLGTELHEKLVGKRK